MTILRQALGSLYVATEVLLKFPPDLFIDTMGCPFIYPLVKIISRAKIMTYTHYPFLR
jgi:alpha-1,2-mannosyltransferase